MNPVWAQNSPLRIFPCSTAWWSVEGGSSSPVELRHREVDEGTGILSGAGGDHLPLVVHRHGERRVITVGGCVEVLLPEQGPRITKRRLEIIREFSSGEKSLRRGTTDARRSARMDPKNIRVGRCAWICPESKSDGQAKAWTPNVARTK